MTECTFRGPLLALGSTIDGDGNVIPADGPSGLYQGYSFLDPRYYPAGKDSQIPGRVFGFYVNSTITLTDTIGQATGTAGIATAQTATSGTPFNLVNVAIGGSSAGTASTCVVPLIPWGRTSAASNVLAIDYGFTTGTCSAGNATVSVPDSTLFHVGQWVVLGGTGSGNSSSGVAQVQTTPTATSITVSPAPVAALTNAPIGAANGLGLQYGPPTGNVVPTAATPYTLGGVMALFNPAEGLARNITVSGSASASGGNVIVSGYDVYGVAMTETIVAPTTATTTAGKKAFKFISSVVPQFTDAGHNYTVGLGNLAGINLRADKVEYCSFYFNGGVLTSNNGFVAATAAASGDVRGTINMANASGFNSAFDGAKRLVIMCELPLVNVVNATAQSTTSMFGATQT